MNFMQHVKIGYKEKRFSRFPGITGAMPWLFMGILIAALFHR